MKLRPPMSIAVMASALPEMFPGARARVAEEAAAMRLMVVVGPDQRLLDLTAEEVKRRTELFARSHEQSPRLRPHPYPKVAAITSVTDDVVRGFLL